MKKIKNAAKKLQKTLKKLAKTQKTINIFFNKCFKNYMSMKTIVKKIWVPLLFIVCLIGVSACNVTRVVTNESQYYQKGDTAVTIQTKTIESYNAVKNN